MNRPGVGGRLFAFARSIVLLAGIVVGVPWALVFAARQRFGGAAPLHGVPSPADWSADRIWGALTDRLTDQTVADVVIRLALVVAWVGVAALVVTVIAEVMHMVRHDGLAMPDIRGFGLSQRTARIIAAGLLVVVPLLSTSSPAIAESGPRLLPQQRDAISLELPADDLAGARGAADAVVRHVPPRSAPVDRAGSEAESATPAPAVPGSDYVVRAGDSVFGIAERMAGPDTSAVSDYAAQMIELNMGRQMPDGRHFNNAAFIDVGWVLELPATSTAESSVALPDGVHVVEEGESLWSIADEELGDPMRWPEIYEENAGRTFDDGRRLDDPDLIHPGWSLDVPGAAAAPQVTPAEQPPDHHAPAAHVADESPATDPPPVDAPDITITSGVGDTAAGSAGSSGDESDATGVDEGAFDEVAFDEVAFAAESPRPDQVWMDAGSLAAAAAARDDGSQGDDGAESEAPAILAYGSAAMLSAGVLALLAVRRRNQLRRARPRARLPEPADRPAATERVLRAIGSGERFDRVDVAIRAAAAPLIEHGRRVAAVLVAPDGSLELRATGPAELPAPWEGAGDTWSIPASIPPELLADHARPVASPCPTLVQLGRDVDDRDVYVDLEALEALEIGGPGAQADAVVAAIAATLSGSVLAEVTTLIGLGVSDDAFLGHRNYVPVRDTQRAFAAATDAVGSTASMSRTTFDLRTRVTSGETWEPAAVLVGASAGTVKPPTNRTGLAVVSASPIHGPSSRLAPDGDAWQLLPARIRLVPVGLTPDDIGSIAELVTIADAEPEPAPVASAVPGGDDHTLLPPPADGPGPHPMAAEALRDDGVVASPAALDHRLLVKLIGAVEVVDTEGTAVEFERSKTRELVAWLATHRQRSTRSAARTALWEQDVRDATFANVVSEARRSLARLVEPPEGDEWVGRTMTESLPLHDAVVTDADLVQRALETARLQPPAQAVETLAPAVDLITGVPFAGTSYLWPDAEGITSSLVLLATSATSELAAHCLSIGDVEGVFRATNRGLQVLPGHEELIGLRMQAHARAGDHAGVRQEWETYERVITTDPWSDGEPAPKLVELRRRLLNPSA